MKAVKFVALLFGALPFLPLSAGAVTVGVPVSDFGETSPVGNVSNNGTINFFIPLHDVQTYGRNGGGLSSDTCIGAGCGGKLNMYVKYTPEFPGANIVNFIFEDLDLEGFNDPVGFLESFKVYDENDVRLGMALDSTSSMIDQAHTSATSQVLKLIIPDATGPFWLKLVFKAYGTITGANTVESMLTTVSAAPPVNPPVNPVPLPPAVALFGSGLAAMGLLGRLRKRRVAAA